MPNIPHIRRRPGRAISGIRGATLILLAGLGLGGCNYRWGMPDPASEQGEKVLDLWVVSFYGAVALGAIVLGLLFYSMIRHRRKSDELPKQTEGSIFFEVTYTVIPFIIVGLLFAYGVKVQADVVDLKKDPDLKVQVTGYQWNWRFTYPDSDVTVIGDNQSLPELVLPVDERTRFDLVAADVNHAFFVPGFLTKRDLIPGVRNEIDITPSKTGFFMGHCAEFCGVNHSQMNFRVRVVPQAEFTQWLQQQKEKAATS
jgi:cytochrome c oxidase subunit 2